MARRRRIGPKDVTQHVVQRGNNRKVCFKREQDFIVYASWLKQYSEKFNVALHAWVFMTNHVHLLCTPRSDNLGVSQMMQSLGRKYVRYFNDTYKQTGTLWEGRFKSSLVCTSTYLLNVYRYIELNPVRAKMVNEPWQYKWSSYHNNALGVLSELCKPHDIYLQLGTTCTTRLSAYRSLFNETLPQSLINEIRVSLNKEIVLGDDEFKGKIETMIGSKLKSGKMGRPVKQKVTLTPF
ncbi:transposase [Glaciecola sp. 2405UD65-10]|uniref:transposase n=1 Tax=Glaciecola sp. 2405UD65-10 TaxID=3397244 RepID=UPI003B58BF93